MSNNILQEGGKSVDEEKFKGIVQYHGINIKEEIYIKKHVKTRVESIVGEGVISSLLLMLLKYNLITLEDTKGGEYPHECEIKVLDITPESIEKDTKKSLVDTFGLVKVFEGKITDLYYTNRKKKKGMIDGENYLKHENGDKISFRTRQKTKTHDEEGNKLDKNDKTTIHYCTIKMRDKELSEITHTTDKKEDIKLNFRNCHEEEFIIENIILFNELLKLIKLYNYKSKFKKRIQYVLNVGLVLDFDKYQDIPGFVEFEGTKKSVIAYYMEIMNVINKETSARGSGGLDERYPEIPIIKYR